MVRAILKRTGLLDWVRSFRNDSLARCMNHFFASLRPGVLSLNAQEWRGLNVAFGQLGEDLVIANLVEQLGDVPRFHVDIGAYDPIRLPNTHLLHRSGWRGINVDPNPGAIRAFDAVRPNDVNLCAAVTSAEANLFYLEYPWIRRTASSGRTSAMRATCSSSYRFDVPPYKRGASRRSCGNTPCDGMRSGC